MKTPFVLVEEAFARRLLRQATDDGLPHHKFDGQQVARLDGIQLSRHRRLTGNALATDEELADPFGHCEEVAKHPSHCGCQPPPVYRVVRSCEITNVRGHEYGLGDGSHRKA
jgi:hypothetical protein